MLPYFLDEKVLRVETIYQVLELEEKTLSYAIVQDKKKSKKKKKSDVTTTSQFCLPAQAIPNAHTSTKAQSLKPRAH